MSALVIVAYCTAAFVAAVRLGTTAKARIILTQGAILGMSIKTIAACLKTIELQTWNQIGIFAAIFLLRTTLKKVFVWESKIADPQEQVRSS
jgi:hypothetical protein